MKKKRRKKTRLPSHSGGRLGPCQGEPAEMVISSREIPWEKKNTVRMTRMEKNPLGKRPARHQKSKRLPSRYRAFLKRKEEKHKQWRVSYQKKQAHRPKKHKSVPSGFLATGLDLVLLLPAPQTDGALRRVLLALLEPKPHPSEAAKRSGLRRVEAGAKTWRRGKG